jgi:hypothetical protein
MMKNNKKKGDGENRRRFPRLNPADIPFLKNVEFNQGSDVRIINISQGGMLLETETRLRPDFKIYLKLVTTEGVFKMDGTILRSSISSLQGAPKYRTAIAFERPFELLTEFGKTPEKPKEEAAPEIKKPETASGKKDEAPLQNGSPENAVSKDPAILTVIAGNSQGIYLNKSFEVNDW